MSNINACVLLMLTLLSLANAGSNTIDLTNTPPLKNALSNIYYNQAANPLSAYYNTIISYGTWSDMAALCIKVGGMGHPWEKGRLARLDSKAINDAVWDNVVKVCLTVDSRYRAHKKHVHLQLAKVFNC
jgi:hypothetical protein